MFTDILFLKNEKPKVNKKTKKPKKEKSEKKPKGTFFWFLVFITIIGGTIGTLKAVKVYRQNSEKKITAKDMQTFKMQNEQTVQQKQKNKKTINDKQEKEQLIENKRALQGFLMTQDKSAKLTEQGIKLLLSGEEHGVGSVIYKNFKLDSVKIKTKGDSLSDTEIIFSITKNKQKIDEISLKLKDIYNFYYYYEGVKIEPKGSPSLRTKMKFVGNEIKKDFFFKDFQDTGKEVIFTFNLKSNILKDVVRYEDLK